MKRSLCPFFNTECIGDKCMSYEVKWRDIDPFQTWHTDTYKFGGHEDSMVGVRLHYIQQYEPYCRALRMYIPTQPKVEVGDCSFCSKQIIFKKYYAYYDLITSGSMADGHPFFNERKPICDECIEKIKNKELDP